MKFFIYFLFFFCVESTCVIGIVLFVYFWVLLRKKFKDLDFSFNRYYVKVVMWIPKKKKKKEREREKKKVEVI